MRKFLTRLQIFLTLLLFAFSIGWALVIFFTGQYK